MDTNQLKKEAQEQINKLKQELESLKEKGKDFTGEG